MSKNFYSNGGRNCGTKENTQKVRVVLQGCIIAGFWNGNNGQKTALSTMVS